MNIKAGLVFSSALVVALNAGPIESLRSGEWYEVPNSQLRNVAPKDWSANVIDPWSGGAFDTKRDKLIVWGGGHGDYSGNEIYTFSLDSLKWQRENDPSSPPAVDSPYAADGGPCSRHTYDYIQYLPTIDRFCSFGGTGFYQSGQTGTNHTDVFDFATKKWSALADCPSNGIGAFSAVDALTGQAWCHGTVTSSQTRLSEYDPVTNTWTSCTDYNNDLQYAYYFTAVIDPVNKKFIATGHNQTCIWDISNLSSVTERTLSKKPAAGSPGFDYDSRNQKLVAWSGGQTVSIFDTKNDSWSTVQGSGATPTAPCQQGTFGRWRYSPNKNVFVLVNATNENVFLYRLSDINVAIKQKEVTENANRRALFIKQTDNELTISIGRPCYALDIFAPNGKTVQKLTPKIYNGPGIWHIPNMRLGTYIVKADFGCELIIKAFTVLR